LVGTYDGSAQRIFVNGVEVASATFSDTITLDGYDVGIGSLKGNTPAYLFAGLIDDIRIYSRPLAASEIQAIYNAEK
jgi:beta-galactosidase